MSENEVQEFWAAVYEEDRAYGGPEEGGWWFDTGVLQESKKFQTEAEAIAQVEAWRKNEYVSIGEVSSVAYRGGSYAFQVTEEAPVKFYPEERPYYE